MAITVILRSDKPAGEGNEVTTLENDQNLTTIRNAINAVQPDGAQNVSQQAGNQLTINPRFWVGTQADYDALTPDPDTLYDIVPG